MATIRKGPRAATRKIARKSVKKAAPARRSLAAAKLAKPKRASAPARGGIAKKSTKPKRRIAAAKKSTGASRARKPVGAKLPAAKKPIAKALAAKPVHVKKTKRPVSAYAKKNLATKHLKALVEEKKRHDAQPPAWQAIVHHDHPAPASAGHDTAAQLAAHGPPSVHDQKERGAG